MENNEHFYEDEEDDYEEREYECPICGGTRFDHGTGCPEDESPFARLIRDGYD